MPFVTHCGVTCNPTSGERLREATYSKGEAMPTCANPHLIGADLVLPHEALNEAFRGRFELYSWLRAENEQSRALNATLSAAVARPGPPRAYRLCSRHHKPRETAVGDPACTIPGLGETVRAQAAAGLLQRPRVSPETATVDRGGDRRLIESGAGTDHVRTEAHRSSNRCSCECAQRLTRSGLLQILAEGA